MIECHKIEKKRTFPSSEKLRWWGDGEWVNEFDHILFEYKGYECFIERKSIKEPYTKEEHFFGGHLCGYIQIPESHSLFNKELNDLYIDCHGGLTYFKDNQIGFDCAHSCDLVPSMEKLRKKYRLSDDIMPIPEAYKNMAIFNPVYRNMEYCIEECKKMVDQLIEL